MSRRSITTDERFLLLLFSLAPTKEHGVVLLSELEEAMRLSNSKSRNIARLLAQTGFVVYSHREGVLSLTKKGESLCEQLQADNRSL